MKFLHVIALGLIGSAIAVAGCSSGNSIYYTGNGVRCPQNYDPLPPEPDKDDYKKPQNKINGFEFPDQGTYEFAGAEVYFMDAKSDARVLVRATRAANGSAQAEVHCVRNIAKLSRGGKIDALTGARDFTVDENKNVTSFRVEDYGYRFDGTTLAAFSSLSKDNFHSLEEVFPESKPGEPQFYDKVRAYCVGRCVPSDEKKTYQIRAYRKRTYEGRPVITEIVMTYEWKSEALRAREQSILNKTPTDL